MLRLSILALALVATGCSSDNPTDDRLADPADQAVPDSDPIVSESDEVAFSSDLQGAEVESVLTTDGKVELGLTDRVLYSRLSKEAQAEVTSGMQDAEDEGGLGGRIASAVSQAVAENIGTAVQVPLEDIRDIRVDGDRLVIEMADGGGSPFESIQTDDAPIFDRIAPADARRLADAFDAVRQ